MTSPAMLWDGLYDAIHAGLTADEVRRLLFVKRYHREHPEEHRRCGMRGRGGSCSAMEALAAAEARRSAA